MEGTYVRTSKDSPSWLQAEVTSKRRNYEDELGSFARTACAENVVNVRGRATLVERRRTWERMR